MSPFARKPPACAGLDIGSDSIKLLQFSGCGQSIRIQHVARAPLPPGAVAGGIIHHSEQVAAAVGQALDTAGASPAACAIAVSGPAVITRTLHLPQTLLEDEIEAHVELEARQQIPFPRDELSLDFAVLGPLARDPGQLEILLAAARNEVVQGRREAAEAAGLAVAAVDIEAIAIANAWAWKCAREAAGVAGACGIFDLGADKITLVVMHAARLRYWREHHNDERAGADVQDAAQRIARALQFYTSSGNDTALRALYLTGGGAASGELAARVRATTGIACRIADPLAALSFEAHSAMPEMMTACGLALHGVRETA